MYVGIQIQIMSNARNGKETQMVYQINFYFKKGIQLLSFQAEEELSAIVAKSAKSLL